MHYVKRIDGLRGLSVLAVVLYHLNLPYFHGGFIGVDIFFVISGFLITGIIQSSIDRSDFSLATFYLRRIKRLLPALYFMLFAMAAFAIIFYLPHEIKDIYQAIVATTVYLSNVFNYHEVDYFNTFYAQSPLLHTWSLSVEEQFYLLYPVILILLKKAPHPARVGILCALTIISFAASVYYIRIDKLYTFYYPWFRGWELGLGGITYLCRNSKLLTHSAGKPKANAIYYLALVTIILSVVFCRVEAYVPNLGVLPAVIAACIILTFNASNQIYADVLEIKPLVFVGLISYSLYLWHQPILSIMYKVYGELSVVSILLTVLLSFVMAILSWRFIERPVRHLKAPAPVVWACMITLSLTLVSVGLYGHYSKGFMNYFLSKIPKDKKGWFINRDDVFSKRDKLWRNILKENKGKKDLQDLDYLIIGDSKGEDMTTAFNLNDSIRKNYKFYYLRVDDEEMGAVADALTGKTMAQLIKSKKTKHDDYSRFNLLERLPGLKVKHIIFTCTWQDKTNADVNRLIAMLAPKVPKTYVVSTANWNDVTSLSLQLAKSEMNKAQMGTFFYKNIRDDWKRQSDNLHLMLKGANIAWINKEDAFCNMKDSTCNLYSDKKSAYIYDTGHLTIDGAIYFGNYMLSHNWFDLGKAAKADNVKAN